MRRLTFILSLFCAVELAEAKIITVNSTNNLTPSTGETNLVQAIKLLQDGDTIHFAIPGTGPFYLATPPLDPNNGYPAITNQNVTIDGYSQPGAFPNTNTILASNTARIQIVLDSRSGGLHVEDISGYSLMEGSTLLVKGVTNVTIRGLSFLGPGFGSFTEEDPSGYAVSFAVGATHGHVEGCWIGLDPNGSDVSGFAAGVTSFQSDAGDDTTVGVSRNATSTSIARSDFNILIGEFIPVILEGNHLRISGNFFNVFPGGKTDFLADGTPERLLQAFIEISSSDNLNIGVDGDGHNDAEERNIFGGVIFATDEQLVEWYGPTGTNMVVAGNYFGMGVDGATRFVNCMRVFGTVKTGGVLRFGSDFDGVSDDLEGNLVAMNHPFATLFPSPQGAQPPLFADMESGARVSLRGNRLIGNNLAPFSYADGAGDRLSDFTNYCTPFMDTSQSIVPNLSTNSTQGRLRGSCAKGIAPYTNILVDVYLADEEGLSNGQLFQISELGYLDDATSLQRYHGFPQGSTYLGSFVDNGPLDLDPAIGNFEFDIASMGIGTGKPVTITANYSADTAGTPNGRTHTSNFALPVSLEIAPRLSFRKAGNSLLLSWPTNAGAFLIQSNSIPNATTWHTLSPQPSISVAGTNFQTGFATGTGNVYYRLTR